MERGLRVAVMLIVLGGALAACEQEDYEAGGDAYKRGDYATALRLWRPLAEQGDADAQLLIGVMYKTGRGVPQDYVEAARWLHRSAQQGQPSAQGILGIMYLKGQGVPQDYVKAYAYFSVAAAQGVEDGGKARDALAQIMTPEQISAAEDMAVECARRDYSGCKF